MKFVVFWLSHNDYSGRGWTTPATNARFKAFDDEEKALLFYNKMAALGKAGLQYQSRRVGVVTKNF